MALLAPFWVLSVLQQKERLAFLALDGVFGLGYFLLVFFEFPHQMDANLFDYGLITVFTGRIASHNLARTTASVLLEKLPFFVQLAPALFAVPLLAMLVLSFPTQRGTAASRLAAGQSAGQGTGGGKAPAQAFAPVPAAPVPLRVYAFACFGFGVLVCWFLPSLWTWVQCF